MKTATKAKGKAVAELASSSVTAEAPRSAEQLVIEKVNNAATAGADKRPRIHKDLKGFARQGDIYIHRVPVNHPHGKATKDRQLAHGHSMGSRHIVKGKVKCYAGTTLPTTCKEPRTFLGPMIEADGPFVIEHPEHAHHEFLAAGCYQVTHQMDAMTGERVID